MLQTDSNKFLQCTNTSKHIRTMRNQIWTKFGLSRRKSVTNLNELDQILNRIRTNTRISTNLTKIQTNSNKIDQNPCNFKSLETTFDKLEQNSQIRTNSKGFGQNPTKTLMNWNKTRQICLSRTNSHKFKQTRPNSDKFEQNHVIFKHFEQI